MTNIARIINYQSHQLTWIYVLVDFFCGIDIGLWKTNVTRGESNNMVFKKNNKDRKGKCTTKSSMTTLKLIIVCNLTIFELFSRF
jgi:magnesium-transporting ATPase (P-type)